MKRVSCCFVLFRVLVTKTLGIYASGSKVWRVSGPRNGGFDVIISLAFTTHHCELGILCPRLRGTVSWCRFRRKPSATAHADLDSVCDSFGELNRKHSSRASFTSSCSSDQLSERPPAISTPSASGFLLRRNERLQTRVYPSRPVAFRLSDLAITTRREQLRSRFPDGRTLSSSRPLRPVRLVLSSFPDL